MNGQIDDVMVFSRAITSNEVWTIYTNGIAGREAQ
jgi:hypothetical protein